mmetsp:Transcript_5175/g.7027  ORF Transcript_5175/g.7027 Transcript_5175/m.7027 type:complete len:235 (-) Transcript_5175:354-1058(-)
MCSIFIMLSTYALDPVENLNPRYTVSAGLLISTILFHTSSVMKSTSHSSQMSYFDIIMTLTYTINVVTVQFNVAIFLIDRLIIRIDRRNNSEAYKSVAHKVYLQAINNSVFAVMLLGTATGLLGLFQWHSILPGLVLLCFGPPLVAFVVHQMKWRQLPGNSSPDGLQTPSWWRRIFPGFRSHTDNEHTELDEMPIDFADEQVQRRLLHDMDDRSSTSSLNIESNIREREQVAGY